jgi:hypothetical protein
MTGVNRGVAYGEGMVFVGSFDGRLNALDAKTGKTLGYRYDTCSMSPTPRGWLREMRILGAWRQRLSQSCRIGFQTTIRRKAERSPHPCTSSFWLERELNARFQFFLELPLASQSETCHL